MRELAKGEVEKIENLVSGIWSIPPIWVFLMFDIIN